MRKKIQKRKKQQLTIVPVEEFCVHDLYIVRFVNSQGVEAKKKYTGLSSTTPKTSHSVGVWPQNFGSNLDIRTYITKSTAKAAGLKTSHSALLIIDKIFLNLNCIIRMANATLFLNY